MLCVHRARSNFKLLITQPDLAFCWVAKLSAPAASEWITLSSGRRRRERWEPLTLRRCLASKMKADCILLHGSILLTCGPDQMVADWGLWRCITQVLAEANAGKDPFKAKEAVKPLPPAPRRANRGGAA